MKDKKYFDVVYKLSKKKEAIWKEFANYIQRYIKKDSCILDIGAGYCCFINNIVANEKHAVDIEEDFVNYANSNVHTHVRSGTDLSNFKDNYFDVVFACNVLEHLTQEELDKTILETRRVLKEGGSLIIIQPNFTYAYKNYFDDYTHKIIFTHISLSDYLEVKNFKIKKLVPKFMPYSFRSKIPKSSFLTKIYLRLPYKILAKQMLIIAKK